MIKKTPFFTGTKSTQAPRQQSPAARQQSPAARQQSPAARQAAGAARFFGQLPGFAGSCWLFSFVIFWQKSVIICKLLLKKRWRLTKGCTVADFRVDDSK